MVFGNSHLATCGFMERFRLGLTEGFWLTININLKNTFKMILNSCVFQDAEEKLQKLFVHSIPVLYNEAKESEWLFFVFNVLLLN